MKLQNRVAETQCSDISGRGAGSSTDEQKSQPREENPGRGITGLRRRQGEDQHWQHHKGWRANWQCADWSEEWEEAHGSWKRDCVQTHIKEDEVDNCGGPEEEEHNIETEPVQHNKLPQNRMNTITNIKSHDVDCVMPSPTPHTGSVLGQRQPQWRFIV